MGEQKLECSLDLIDSRLTSVAEIYHGFDHGPMLQGMTLREAYCEGRLNICFLIDSFDLMSEHACDIKRHEHWAFTYKNNLSLRPFQPHECWVNFPKIFDFHRCSDANGNNQLVLIADIKLMDGMKPVFPGRVRLQRLDCSDNPFSGNLYLSASNGTFHGLRVLAEREIEVIGTRNFVAQQCENQEIERASKIMNSVSEYEGEKCWDGWLCFDEKLTLRQLWNLPDPKFEGFLRQIGIDLPVQIRDVMLGPFNFEPRA
jgi:hypothetical protein